MRFGALAPKIGMGISGVFSFAKLSARRFGVDENGAIIANSGSSRVEKLESKLSSSVVESRSFNCEAILEVVAGDQI